MRVCYMCVLCVYVCCVYVCVLCMCACVHYMSMNVCACVCMCVQVCVQVCAHTIVRMAIGSTNTCRMKINTSKVACT